jgi:hypothetical protein
VRRLLLILSLLPLWIFAAPAEAAPKFCFPQVPDCITSRFASFWQANGGLAVFGLPLTASRNEKVGDQRYKTQYLERARFELHPENQAPYDVLLGRIGVDRLMAQGRDWQTFPKDDPSAPHYFVETGHAIAPQFWGFWSRNGLEFDGKPKAKSLAESLALFGYPISGLQMEQASDGNSYLTQWYERARFEYHPENRAPYDVLLGRLGAEALEAKLQPPPPPGLPGIPAPSGNCVRNAEPAAEGIQAWVTDPTPRAPGTVTSLCARLIVNGAVVPGAQVTAVAHFDEGDASYGPASTGADGVAQIDFNIEKARNRFIVNIDVTIDAPDGQSFTTSTTFRPNYTFKTPPPVNAPPLPNIPAPIGDCIANAPPPLEGAQAWMTVIEPNNPDQFDSICGRLIVNGVVVSGAETNAYAFYSGRDKSYGPATTGPDGVAELGFNLSGARNHKLVFVDVTLKAPDGTEYYATTYFRPNYPDTP